MAIRHDEAFKYLFDLPEMCADALRVVAPALWPHLDAATVRGLRVGDSVAADLSKRVGDALFGVELRAGAVPGGRRRQVVVPVEFQSSDDTGMAGRMREYAALQLETLRRQGLVRGNDVLVLPLVVYDGAGPWTAADGMEPLRGLAPDVAGLFAAYQPQGYALLDLARSRTDDWGEQNRLAAVARLLQAGLAAALAEEFARFAGPLHRPLREALHAWAGELWSRWPGAGALPPLGELEGGETTDMTSIAEARVAEWMAEHVERPLAEARAQAAAEAAKAAVEAAEGRARGMAEGRARGMAEGRARGMAEGMAEGLGRQRALLSRMAARRFGGEAGRAVAEVVADMEDAAALEEVGDLIVDCPTGERLLDGLANGRLGRPE